MGRKQKENGRAAGGGEITKMGAEPKKRTWQIGARGEWFCLLLNIVIFSMSRQADGERSDVALQ